ncbi:MAG: lipocalin-like domain-containing protein, partial [Proteobacteria bacterium]|nr:lipocalin-like domain-containing protein [Pseudomonadota bacterium]
VGIWKLKSCKLITEEGQTLYPFGETPSGYLFYENHGFMSLHITRGPQKPNEATGLTDITAEEARDVLMDYFSYCGKYDVVENTIYHYIEMSTNPNWVGMAQERRCSLKDDVLTIQNPLSYEKKEVQLALVWQRAHGLESA